MQHTKGPWKSKGVYIYPPEDDKPIGAIVGQHREASANLKLMTAAPDLLAACRAFVEAYERSLQLEKTDVALRMAKEAIEKAQPNKAH